MKEEIKELFRKLIPNTYKIKEDDIDRFIDFLIDREKVHNSVHTCWSYGEAECANWGNKIIDAIHYELIDQSNDPKLTTEDKRKMYLADYPDSVFNREPKDDYEKGIFTCIGLLVMQIHWMNPAS